MEFTSDESQNRCFLEENEAAGGLKTEADAKEISTIVSEPEADLNAWLDLDRVQLNTADHHYDSPQRSDAQVHQVLPLHRKKPDTFTNWLFW